MTSEKRKHLYRSIKILLERHKIFLILLIPHTPQQRNVHNTYAIDTRTSLIRRRSTKRESRIRHTYVTHMSHVRSRYERYAVYTPRLRGMLPATYVWRIRSMSYVSTAYLPRCFRMYHACVMFVRRTYATYVSGYEFLSAHIKNVAPRRMSYVCSRMYDVRVTDLSYIDTP